jgi:hypothetical protein
MEGWHVTRWFLRDGTEVDTSDPRAWVMYAMLFDDEDYKRVRWTALPDGWALSTIWLGTDHSIIPRPDAAPLYFETALVLRGHVTDVLCRYPSEASAEAGHELAVATATLALASGADLADALADAFH